MAAIRITDWSRLGSAVRELRRGQGLSQVQLAERAGVARSWLARVEAGHRGAELDPILRLLKALGAELVLRDPPQDEAGAAEPDDVPGGLPGLSDDVLRAVRESASAAAASRRERWGAAPRSSSTQIGS